MSVLNKLPILSLVKRMAVWNIYQVMQQYVACGKCSK